MSICMPRDVARRFHSRGYIIKSRLNDGHRTYSFYKKGYGRCMQLHVPDLCPACVAHKCDTLLDEVVNPSED